MKLSDWETPDPAEAIPLTKPSHWETLARRHSGTNDAPLRQALDIARRSGAKSVVRETRYVDLDYRSEYSAYYSRAFQRYPDAAVRLHFFRYVVTTQRFGESLRPSAYLGYMVIRPTPVGQVGRTMLAPPPDIAPSVRTAVEERVHLFGQTLTVVGVPFVQQDTQLGRCAHAAAWVCHYTAHRRGLVGRRPMSAFAAGETPDITRPVPSSGLTTSQIVEVMRRSDLPPVYYSLQSLPPSTHPPMGEGPRIDPTGKDRHPGYWDTRMISLCCRYLNSGFPVLIGTTNHAFVLCGYKRVIDAAGKSRIQFIRQDDQNGPYVEVGDVFNDGAAGVPYSPWHSIIIPLPDKLWLRAEDAERVGFSVLATMAAEHAAGRGGESIAKARSAGRLALRTYAIHSNDFKARVAGRLDATVAKSYRLARFPRYVWVVEAVDRDARDAGKPCVLGEVVFDATSSGTLPRALAVHVPGVAIIMKTPGPGAIPVFCTAGAYETGGVGPA